MDEDGRTRGSFTYPLQKLQQGDYVPMDFAVTTA